MKQQRTKGHSRVASVYNSYSAQSTLQRMHTQFTYNLQFNNRQPVLSDLSNSRKLVKSVVGLLDSKLFCKLTTQLLKKLFLLLLQQKSSKKSKRFKTDSHFVKMQNVQLLSFVLRQLHSSWVQRELGLLLQLLLLFLPLPLPRPLPQPLLQPFNSLFFHDNLGNPVPTGR